MAGGCANARWSQFFGDTICDGNGRDDGVLSLTPLAACYNCLPLAYLTSEPSEPENGLQW